MTDTHLADPIVNWGQMGRLALTAILVGVGIPAASSLGLLGFVRAGERHGEGHQMSAAGYALLALAAAVVCAGAVYLALTTVVAK